MPVEQITFMTGPVTWEGVVALFTIGGIVVTGVFSVLVWYFTSRTGELDKIREILKERDAAWERKHDVHRAEVAQAHRELHDRISRTNDRILDTERTSRDDTAKALQNLEAKVMARIEGLSGKLDKMTEAILTSIKSQG